MILAPFFLLLLALAQTPPGLPEEIAGKPLGELLEEWPEQYVKWILTKSERDAYRALPTEREKLEFIEFFWARRDPDPETVENEYRREYLERFAFVVNHLSAGRPGWSTDRGRLYLILGPPHSVQQNPMGRYGLERPSEIWTYNNLDIPGFPASFDFEFVDFNGTGNFELVQDIHTSASVWNQFGTVNNALDAVAQRRQVIGEVDPATGMDRFRDVDGTRMVMREFDLQQRVHDVMSTPERTLPELRTEVASRAAFGDLGVTATGGAVWIEGERARVPVQITVPYRELLPRDDGARTLYELDYAIVASKDDGEEVDRVDDELTLAFERDQTRGLQEVRLSIQEVLDVPAGAFRVVAYIRDRNRNHIGNVEFPLLVPKKPGEGLGLSSLFLAGEILPANTAESKPFQFGSVRLIPAAERVFRADDTLKLYLEAYGSGAAEDGRKRLRIDFFVMRDGKLFLGIPASFLRPEAEPVGVTGRIPLRKCVPGEYAIRVRVTDETSGSRAETEAAFSVRP
ncbi:MAG: GWxTD domain-containing protein [Vicinamibacteria bacterium]